MRMLSLEKPVEKWETEEIKENYDWLKMNQGERREKNAEKQE